MKKIEPQYNGGLLNKSIDEYSILILQPHLSNPTEFKKEFVEILASYRLAKRTKDTEPMPKEKIHHIKKLIRQVENLKQNIALLPDDAHTLCNEAISYMYKDLPHLEILYSYKLNNLLENYVIALNFARGKIETCTNNKGRKADTYLNYFIYETYQCLKKHLSTDIKKNELYGLISTLLIKNNIHVPTKPENIGKIIRNIKKVKNDTSKV